MYIWSVQDLLETFRCMAWAAICHWRRHGPVRCRIGTRLTSPSLRPILCLPWPSELSHASSRSDLRGPPDWPDEVRAGSPSLKVKPPPPYQNAQSDLKQQISTRTSLHYMVSESPTTSPSLSTCHNPTRLGFSAGPGLARVQGGSRWRPRSDPKKERDVSYVTRVSSRAERWHP